MVCKKAKLMPSFYVDASKAHCFLEPDSEGLLQLSEASSIKEILCMLRTCRQRKHVRSARHLYSYICRRALLNDRSIGNHLVPVFVDCGCLRDAELVFSILSHPNEHSWTSLILGYARNGRLHHAFRLYQRMQESSIIPTSYTLVGLLQSCARSQNTAFGQEIHLELVRKGLDKDLFIHSALLDMYAKCGSVLDAQEVFNGLSNRDVVSWTALVAAYAEHGPFEAALRCFRNMQDEGIQPNSFTFSCVLKACGNNESMDQGHGMHMHVAIQGLERDFFLGKSIVAMYVKCGALSDAWRVFIQLPAQDVVAWTSLLAGYADDGPSEEAFSCFEEMQTQGIEPDAFAFSSILKVCSNAGAVEKGFEMHKQINQEGFESDLAVGTALVSMYVLCGCLAEAQEVFDGLPRRCVVAWNALIGGFVERGAAEKALELFHKMKDDDEDEDDDEEEEDGIFPDAFTFAHVLKACGLLGDAGSGRIMHAEAVLKGFDEECFVGSTIVSMYAKSRLLAEAKAVFDQLKVKEVVSWTALIAGYAEHGPAQEALECFGKMQDSGVPLDDFTLASVLKACGSIGAIGKGYAMHGEALEKGFERDLCVGTALLDMYAKSASPDEARIVFDKLPIRDVTSWNALICGLSDHGGQIALDCFTIMRRERVVMPDSITFSGLLTACAHSSLVREGRDIFRMMMEEYAISPTVDHYTCMIDLLARTGRLREAAKYLESTPSPPSIETWRALLNACKLYGEVELGSKCFRHLLRIDPELAASHVLMADVYAGSESWDKVITLDGIETF